jgi:hypothetical protein
VNETASCTLLDHRLTRQYDSAGKATGLQVCTTCNMTFTPEQMEVLEIPLMERAVEVLKEQLNDTTLSPLARAAKEIGLDMTVKAIATRKAELQVSSAQVKPRHHS